jgi:integrase
VSAGIDPATGRYARVIRTVRTTSKREAKAALRRLEEEVASGRIGLEDPTVDNDTGRAGYVFSFDADGGSAWRGDVVSARWIRACRAAGVTAVRLHDLRHWQATQLLDAGVPVPTVAARLGHADGTTTMRIYAHRTTRGDERAAAAVGAALASRPARSSG